MRLAGLLGVCAANDLGAWRNRGSDPLLARMYPTVPDPRRPRGRKFTIVDRLLRVESAEASVVSLGLKNERFPYQVPKCHLVSKIGRAR